MYIVATQLDAVLIWPLCSIVQLHWDEPVHENHSFLQRKLRLLRNINRKYVMSP